MATKKLYTPKGPEGPETVPFSSAEEAWFWFIQAQQARNEGARITAGSGLYPRPCEPLDILKVLDRLYRKRELLMDHMLVLRHYGRRLMPPDPSRLKERRAHHLWQEALGFLEMILVSKGIVYLPPAQFSFYGEAAE